MEHAETVVAVHPYASVRWGAILGGWIVATGIATLMYVAGLAFGFSAFDPYNASASAKGIDATKDTIIACTAASAASVGFFSPTRRATSAVVPIDNPIATA